MTSNYEHMTVVDGSQLIRLKVKGSLKNTSIKASQTGGSCFICLDDDESQPLTQCCTQCYALTHESCWKEYRGSQQMANLRARLLGLNRPDPLNCTICRSGLAFLRGEADGVADLGGDVDRESLLHDQLVDVIGEVGRNSVGEADDTDADPQMCSAGRFFSFLFLGITVMILGILGLWSCALTGMEKCSLVFLFIYLSINIAYLVDFSLQRKTSLKEYLKWILMWEEPWSIHGDSIIETAGEIDTTAMVSLSRDATTYSHNETNRLEGARPGGSVEDLERGLLS